MIKIFGKRYNLDAMQTYEDYITPSIEYAIMIKWRNPQTPDTIIIFGEKEFRDKTIEAMDEVSLLVKDGEVVVREMPMDMPFMLGGDGFDPPDGMSHH